MDGHQPKIISRIIFNNCLAFASPLLLLSLLFASKQVKLFYQHFPKEQMYKLILTHRLGVIV